MDNGPGFIQRLTKAFSSDPLYYWKQLDLLIQQGEKANAAAKQARKAEAEKAINPHKDEA